MQHEKGQPAQKRSSVMTIKGKAWWLFVLLTVFMSGCHEVKRHYTINPDLSGKVAVYTKISLDPLLQLGSQANQPDAEKARRAAKSIFDATSGVDTWKDVRWSVNDEGKLEFTGTAYFKDFNALNLDTTITSSNKLFLSNEGNRLTLLWKQVEKPVPEKGEKAPPLTGKELERQITIEKAKFKESIGMMSALLGGFKEEESFSLPGEQKSIKGFKTDGNRVVLSIVGKDILTAITTLSEDDKFWRESVAAGKQPLMDGPGDIQQQVFGAPLPYEAVFSGGRNQFDYEAETAAAKAAYPALLESLGITEKPKPLPVALSGYSRFTSLRVGAVSMTFESDPERGIRPNSQDKGYAVHLIGEWEGPVDRVNEVIVSEARTDNGENLLPDDSGSGFMQSPQLSNDKSALVFPVLLKLPTQHAKSLKKLSGTVSFTVMTGAKSHDLGLMKLVAGSKAKEFNVEIIRAGKSPDHSGGSSVALKLAIDYNLLMRVNFYDESQKKLEYNGSSSSCSNDDCEMEFMFTGEIPPKARLVIDAYDGMQTSSTPFMVENLPIHGK